MRRLQLRHDLAVADRKLDWDLRKIEPLQGAHGIIAQPAAV
jgi:hypothetical protein